MDILRKDGSIHLVSKLGKVQVGKDKIFINDYETEWPGEYEVQGISAKIIENNGKNSIRITADGVGVFVAEEVGSEFSEEEIEKIGNVHALVIDADSSNITPKQWKVLIEEVGSQTVVLLGNGEKTAALKKEIGINEVEGKEKISVSASSANSEMIDYFLLS